MLTWMLFALVWVSAANQPTAPAAGALGPVPGQPYERCETTDELGRPISFYLSESAGGAGELPLLVYVQGSGCGSHFATVNGQTVSTTGHSLVERTARGRARTLIVEKPGVSYLDAPNNPGSAEDSTSEFRREHTLDRWATAVLGAIHDAWERDGVDPSRTLVVGHSEGGIVAARIAAMEPRITTVGVLAGEGATQLYSLVRHARAGHFASGIEDADRRVAWIVDGYRRVLADPDNPDAMFFGHPHLRWSTFCVTSPAEQLRDAEASVLVVQGLRDLAVDPSGAEMLYAELLAHGRDVRLMLVPDADHSLNILQDGEIVGSAFQSAVEHALEMLEAG